MNKLDLHKLILINLCWITVTTSCSFIAGNKDSKYVGEYYNFSDTSGNYLMFRETGMTKDHRQVVKKKIYQETQDNMPLEKNISFARQGVEKKVDILIPETSQYIVWLDKKKYISNLKYDYETRKISVTTSEDGIDKPSINVNLKDDKRLVCFFSQLIECVRHTGFFDKAEKEMAGTVRLAIIWDGHPFFQQQYPVLAEEVVSNAILYYDGIRDDREIRYILKLANDNITYIVNRRGEFRQLFWISQGLSITKRQVP